MAVPVASITALPGPGGPDLLPGLPRALLITCIKEEKIVIKENCSRFPGKLSSDQGLCGLTPNQVFWMALWSHLPSVTPAGSPRPQVLLPRAPYCSPVMRSLLCVAAASHVGCPISGGDAWMLPSLAFSGSSSPLSRELPSL